ncbi:MAG: HDOD domain protein [Betaproteobacteria bacterium ADurb.Bin341]|nr:MAG: HDOD domain protein [Betaproteobacteria bacterium ADurb.Bin341]
MSPSPPATEVATDLVSDILKSISIPPCPAVLTTLLQESRREDVDFPKIVRLISSDLGLAASTMKMANSPFFGLRQKVQSVQHAATILGLKNILNIITGISLRQAISPKGINMERFWERSSYHAIVSARLARRIPGISTEDAYTFGLFHDCGIPILMQRFPDYKDTLALANRSQQPMRELENERHNTDHTAVGAMLARNWQLPPLIVDAVRTHHDLAENAEGLPGELRDLSAISLVADYIICDFLNLAPEAERNANGADALDHLGLDADELDDLKHDIHQELSNIRAERG